jgi:prepilin-type N-terminal cleavage/methylation domain-containing protein
MKKGFTLAELLGVVVIISILALLVLPPVINQIRRQRDKIDETTLKVLGESTYLYMDSNKDAYPLTPATNYCITLQQLADANVISPPIKDRDGNNIALEEFIRVEIITKTNINYSLVDTCS